MSELATRVRAKYPGVYDDLTDADLEKAVLAKHPEYADLATPTKAAEPARAPSFMDSVLADNAGLPPILRAGQAMLRLAKEHPVQTGAVVGGLAAAPLTGGGSIPAAMAAAGLGAAGGAGLAITGRQLATGQPEDPTQTAKTMATEGALGAMGEGAGQGAARILSAGGKLVYKTALRPSMGLQREFGDLAATGLKEGAPVSQGGLAQVIADRGASAQAARRMITDAEAAGAPSIPTKEVAKEFGDVFAQGRNQAQLGRPDPRPAVWQRLQTFDAKNPGGIPLGRAQALKEEAQDLASRAYRAEDLGHPITDLSAAADRAMAGGLQRGIEARVPGVADTNAQTRDLIGLSRALEDATRRNVPGVGSLRSLLGDFAPATASHAGIAAHQVGQSGVLPPSFLSALIAALGGDQQMK